MEIKINREIRQYTESMFFGLSMRQFFFSLIAAVVAVILYFVLKPHFGTETVSWICILGAAPFAALGFVTYHGMTAEQFIWAWIRSELLEPKELHFESVNRYQFLIKPTDKKETSRSGSGRNWPSHSNDVPCEKKITQPRASVKKSGLRQRRKKAHDEINQSAAQEE